MAAKMDSIPQISLPLIRHSCLSDSQYTRDTCQLRRMTVDLRLPYTWRFPAIREDERSSKLINLGGQQCGNIREARQLLILARHRAGFRRVSLIAGASLIGALWVPLAHAGLGCATTVNGVAFRACSNSMRTFVNSSSSVAIRPVRRSSGACCSAFQLPRFSVSCACIRSRRSREAVRTCARSPECALLV